jgi:hypothetical protein
VIVITANSRRWKLIGAMTVPRGVVDFLVSITGAATATLQNIGSGSN